MRLSAGNLKPTYTGGAERQRGERRVNQTTVRKTKTDIETIILRIWLLRNLAFFVSRYLKFWYLKRYVGGLVHSMNKQLHIDLLGLLLLRVSDDVRSASLFVRFLFLLKLKHNEQK